MPYNPANPDTTVTMTVRVPLSLRERISRLARERKPYGKPDTSGVVTAALLAGLPPATTKGARRGR